MKNPLSKMITAAVVSGALICAMAAINTSAQNAPGVSPRGSSPYGKSYEQWSVAHWQWCLSLPATANPLFDTAPVSTGQSGPVWFLGGKFCATTPGAPACNPQVADRTVTIPVGKALFFPIFDGECSTIEGNGTTYTQLRDCVQPLIDLVTGLACEIDGRPVQNLAQYRALSPLFTYTLASHDNVWAAVGEPVPDGASTPAVSDGYFIMLEPLPVGEHLLHFHAELPAFGFSLDVTYHITVAAPPMSAFETAD